MSIGLLFLIWTMISLLYVFGTKGYSHYFKEFHILMVPLFILLWAPTLVICLMGGLIYDTFFMERRA